MEATDGIVEVYHAGTERIEFPDCKVGRYNLDFGKGFYVTDIYDQALNFAYAKGCERQLPPIINVYNLNKKALLTQAKTLIFNSYSEDWLEFIVSCRGGDDRWKQYDYVEGGVADDRVINTVNLYIQGVIAEEEALRRLRYLKPNNQICILNQSLLDAHLKFTNSIIVPQNGLL